MAGTPPAKIRKVAGLYFCWDAQDVISLRTKHRVLGKLVGCTPPGGGLPLLLSSYEAWLCHTNGWATIEECVKLLDEQGKKPTYKKSKFDADVYWKDEHWNDQDHAKRRIICAAYMDLWTKGYYVQFSMHSHVDFAIYPFDPLIVHASHFLVCLPSKFSLLARDLIAYSRLAHCANKTVVLAMSEQDAPDPSDIVYIEFVWEGTS